MTCDKCQCIVYKFRMLNSLWGRFSMRNNFVETVIVDDVATLHNLIHDKKLIVQRVTPIRPEVFMVSYKKRDEFVSSHPKYNIVLSLLTTAAGRMKLYEYMDAVVNAPGCELLYTDTDSVFILYPKGQCPIKCGDFLGEMSDQYEDHRVLAYYSTGSKSYALKLQHKQTGKIEHALKCKGVTYNDQVSHQLQYDDFVRMVNNYGKEKKEEVEVNTTRFESNVVDGTVKTVEWTKTVRLVHDKSHIDPNMYCIPFGY
jgi:hypothetical protein